MNECRKAADQGHAHASYNVALGHIKGIRNDLLKPGYVQLTMLICERYRSVPSHFSLIVFISERDTYVHVRYMLWAVRLSVCRLSSVCNVGAPYSAG